MTDPALAGLIMMLGDELAELGWRELLGGSALIAGTLLAASSVSGSEKVSQ